MVINKQVAICKWYNSTIGGGQGNKASGGESTVGGGGNNGRFQQLEEDKVICKWW